MILSTTAPWCGLTILWLTSPTWTRQLDRGDSLKLHTGAVLSPREEGQKRLTLSEVVGGGSWPERLLVGPPSQAVSSQNPCLLVSPHNWQDTGHAVGA